MDGLVFRLFVSSTFADFQAEREILQRDVFPRLRAQAGAGGARFVPIDLRWGVSREAKDQQEAMEICLNEVDRCQAEGQPPRLLALLGHRRGWRPLPPSVPVDVWERGAPALTAADLTLLEQAYRRDDNARPPAWVLQPEAAEESLTDEEKRAKEAAQYARASALVRAGCARDQMRSLLGAATEQELRRAFSQGRKRRPEGNDALILVRTLDHLPAKISAAQKGNAEQFLELRETDGGWAADEKGHAALAGLAAELAGEENAAWARRASYAASWDDARAMVALSERQQRDFADLVFHQLNRMMAVSLRLERPGQALSREGRSHAAVRAQRLVPFAGRDRELARLRDLVPRLVPNETAPPPRPVVVVSGPAGSGKSALLAKASVQAEKDCLVITRFAGATRVSASAAGLCRSINLELAGLLGIEPSHARRDDLFAVADLIALADRQVGALHSRRRLAVFIDGADLVGGQAERVSGRAPTRFRWLPPMMPPEVTLVLSADEANAQALADWFHSYELVPLGPLTPEGAAAMLEQALHQADRSLSPDQFEALLNRERDGWLPLPLLVAARDAIRWPSGPAGKDLPAATTFADVLANRLSKPRRHGEVLVASALGYLLAARDGLAEDELRELLAHDERVIDDLANRFSEHPLPMMKGATRAVPDVVLSRLLQDLGPYLAEYPVGGQALMRLAHDEFQDSARRYVCHVGRRPQADWHRRIAEYFRDQWQAAPAGPAADAPGEPGQDSRLSNARAATELPYQLAQAGEWDKLTAVVTDFGYLETLVTGAGGASASEPSAEGSAATVWTATLTLSEVLALARLAADREPAARQAARVLQSVQDAIVRERRNLARWPRTCWQQLANRLLTAPDAPAVRTAALWWQRGQASRAWLELTSAGAAAALAAAYLVHEPEPGGPSRSPKITAMVSVGPHAEITVMDDAGTLASLDPAGYESPTAFRRPDGRDKPDGPDGPGLVALAPLGDGRVLACDRAGTLELWDVPRYRRQYRQVGSAGTGVTAMAYFPDEHLLVIATERQTYGWEFDGSAAEGRLADEPSWISPRGARWLWPLRGGRLLAVGKDSLRQTWEAACLRAADSTDCWRQNLAAEPRAAALDERRGLLALGDTARRVTLRRLENGALEGTGVDTGDFPTALAFAPPGPDGGVTLLVGRADGWLARHAALGPGEDGLLAAHDGPVSAISVHERSARVITGGADGWVKSWDLGAGEWHEHSAVRHVRAAAFDASGQWVLACCGSDGSYRVGAADGQWTAITGLATPLKPVLAALPGGQGVVVTLKDGSLGWLSAGSGLPRLVPGPPGVGVVKELAVAADGNSVFVADSRGGLSLLPLNDKGTTAGPVTAADGAPITTLAPLPEGGVLAGDGRGLLTTWTADGAGGLSPGESTQARLADITALAVAPGRGAVAVGSWNGEVVLVTDSHEVSLGHHEATVTSVAIGLGGRVAVTAAGGDDPALCVWDLAGKEADGLVTRLPLPDEPIAVGFRPNRPELTVLCRHGRLRNLRLHIPERQT